MQFVALCAGIFVIAASAFDWEWFFTNRKAIFFTNLLGRGGARIFYFSLGVILLLLSYVMHSVGPAATSVGTYHGP